MKSHVVRSHLRHALRLLRKLERIPMERDDGKDLIHCDFCGSAKSHYPDCELGEFLKSLDPLGCPGRSCLCEDCMPQLKDLMEADARRGSEPSVGPVNT